MNQGAAESEITSTVDTISAVPSAPAYATRNSLTTVEKDTTTLVVSRDSAAA